jgi:hypothetical protein
VDKYTTKDTKGGVWRLRAAVDHEHGQGKKGRATVQEAINAGFYKKRMNKCNTDDGRSITIEEVMIPTDKLASTHETGFGSKLRAGGEVSEHEFREGMAKIMGGAATTIEDEPDKKKTMKRPTALANMVALVKEAEQAETSDVNDETEERVKKETSGEAQAASKDSRRGHVK